jgi:hypothetical protein
MLTKQEIRNITADYVEKFNKEYCKSGAELDHGFNYGKDITYYGLYYPSKDKMIISVKHCMQHCFNKNKLIGVIMHECGHYIESKIFKSFSERSWFNIIIREYFANNFAFLTNFKESKELSWFAGDAIQLWRYIKDIEVNPNFWYKQWKSYRRKKDTIIVEPNVKETLKVNHSIINKLMDGVIFEYNDWMSKY